MNSNLRPRELGKVCALVVRIAENYGVPISIEKLDFAKKKASLGDSSSRYARMLSNFAYSTFAQMLLARCLKRGIELIKVEPAYSSVQGLTKFMAMYGMNSGSAAALVLARRALRKSERLPRALHVLPPDQRQDYIRVVHSLVKPKGYLFLKCFSYLEKSESGPYRFTPEEIKEIFSDRFHVISVQETVYQGTLNPLPQALFCILQK